MDIRSRVSLAAVALLALALAACGSDSSPTDGGTSDTTPPSVTSVTPVDDHHIDVTFSEQVTKSSAENESNYTITEVAAPSPVSSGVPRVPGDTYLLGGVTLKNDNKTVTVATQESMAGLNFDLTVHNVSDMTGNKIGEAGSGKSFAGSNTVDATAPTVVSHTPISDATNIALNTKVTVKFSEAVNLVNTSWTSGGGDVPYTFGVDGATLTMTADAPLDFSTTYTVTVRGTDYAGNTGSFTSWTFTTMANNDHTPPTLVSSVPANGAVNVNLNGNLSLTFSEAIDQNSFSPLLTPDIAGTPSWSVDGKTVTFDPTDPLPTNTQFTLQIFPGDMQDLAGNPNTAIYSIVFSTGAALEQGSIAGTVTGDPNSTPAADPTGAFVGAATGFIFNGGGYAVLGISTVAGNNTYSLQHLPDDVYYPLAILDSNHDGNIDPLSGDAIGLFGIDVSAPDLSPDSVTIAGGAHKTGINFKMYDPTSVTGTISYSGAHAGEFHDLGIALFDQAGFDPATATSVVSTNAFWPESPGYFINELEVGLIPNGNYYVGAYLDANDNGNFDIASDPWGLFGGNNTPAAVNLTHGKDVVGRDITLTDPLPGLRATSVHWAGPKHTISLKKLSEAVRQAQLAQQH